MGKDLISRSALLENYGLKNAMKYGNETVEQQHNSYSTLMLYEIAEMIEDAPAVDAVEVVRCRDCRYWRQESLNHLHWVCTKHSTEKRTFCTLPTFFCADGRRN